MYLVTILNALFSANLVSWARQQKVRPGFKVVYVTIFTFFYMKNLVGGQSNGNYSNSSKKSRQDTYLKVYTKYMH